MNILIKVRAVLFSVISLGIFSGCVSGISTDEAAGLYFNLGNAYSELGRDSDAVKAYESARRLDPELFQAGYNLARLHIDAGRFEEGRLLLASLQELDPENVILLEAEAWSYYKEGKEEDALEIYGRILGLQYNHPRALYNSSRIFLWLNEEEKAAGYIYTLWENDLNGSGVPEKNDLLLEWCRLQIALDRREKALDSLLFLESVDSTPEILGLIGDIYFDQEKYGQALEMYEKAVSGEGETSPGILFKKAVILLTVVEDEDAGLEALENALKNGFKDREELKKLVETSGFLFTDQVNDIFINNGIDLENPENEEPGPDEDNEDNTENIIEDEVLTD